MTEHIATSIQNAIAHYREHPDDARATDSVATAKLDEGLRFIVEGPDGASVATDMPTGVGGGNTAPSPGWLLRAGLASCCATLTAMRAAQEGVKLDNLEVTVDSESDDRGILGIDEEVPAGPLSARMVIKVSATDASPEQLVEIATWGHEHCPVSDAVKRPIPLSLEVVTE